MHKPSFTRTPLAAGVALALGVSTATPVMAQVDGSDEPIEEIITVGIRGSLQRAMDIKRTAKGVVDAISAEDIGKFPDQNLAESLQRITGVSIDRQRGEGSQVTVRGFGPQFNTVLVNGRQIATDSSGREFNFDVLSTDLISGADVYKSSLSYMQEGGIGATIEIVPA